MVDDQVVGGGEDGRVFEELEKGFAGEGPALCVLGGEGGGVGESSGKGHDRGFSVQGPSEFLGVGQNDVEVDGDENAF